MYEVAVEAFFRASHQLRLPGGEWEPLHGHDWKVEATFEGPELDEQGLLVDFSDAQSALGAVAQTLHDRHLNDLEALAAVNPSAENVARSIFDRLRSVGSFREKLVSIRVWEAPGCAGGYSRRE